MKEIVKEISDIYGIEIKNISSFRNNYIINTSAGKKLLKKTSLSPGRILFIHGAKEYLYKNNFKNLDRYFCSLEGFPYATINGVSYTINDAIDGKECNFDNPKDILAASKLLASLHSSSKGYIPPENSLCRDNLGKLPSFFSKRLDEIKKIKKLAQKGKNKFDYLLLEHIDYFYKLGEDTIKLILNSKYDFLVKAAKYEGGFCHHDFNHNNIIYHQDNMFVINFEFCSFELKIYDIVNLLRRKMRKCNWDINEAKIIINEYRSIENISDSEFFIMKIMLQFPQKFWRVINKYYNSRRTWSEKAYISKLQEVIDEIPHNKKFIDSFESLI